MSRFRFSVLALVVALTGSASAPPSTPTSTQDDRAQVVATVQALFDAMAAKDRAALEALLLPEGALVSFRDAASEPAVRRQGDLESLVTADAQYLERMWEPTVLIHGPIAQLWTSYDFWLDGEFSHCGVDSFALARSADGWRIVGTSYTVEREGCEPSPLGPPR